MWKNTEPDSWELRSSIRCLSMERCAKSKSGAGSLVSCGWASSVITRCLPAHSQFDQLVQQVVKGMGSTVHTEPEDGHDRVGMLEYAVKTIGPDRVLFGSDFSINDPSTVIARIESSFLIEVQKKCSLEIFRRCLSGWRTAA